MTEVGRSYDEELIWYTIVALLSSISLEAVIMFAPQRPFVPEWTRWGAGFVVAMWSLILLRQIGRVWKARRESRLEFEEE